jgi:hypothetical protein
MGSQQKAIVNSQKAIEPLLQSKKNSVTSLP